LELELKKLENYNRHKNENGFSSSQGNVEFISHEQSTTYRLINRMCMRFINLFLPIDFTIDDEVGFNLSDHGESVSRTQVSFAIGVFLSFKIRLTHMLTQWKRFHSYILALLV
jgi:hypothetical protein